MIGDAALALSQRDDPPAALRDEVVASFDAAVAEPDVAARLGRLLKPEHFSGFGIAPGPELTLVQGGGRRASRTGAPRESGARREAPPAGRKDETAPPAAETAAARRLARALTKARDAFTAADEQHRAAAAAEERARNRVDTLAAEVTELQRDLAAAKQELEAARRDARRAKTGRRDARATLDRAERQANARD